MAQHLCAMKVNTDGVLLAAWANVDEAKRMLDIGTGTGVLAMMLAQKYQTATIDALDVDEEAFIQSKENFTTCPWPDRLTSYHTSLQNFLPDKKYDLIISNPPYFINDLTGTVERKNMAKHSVSLTYEDLIAGIDKLLNENGNAFIVLPIFNVSIFESMALAKGLFVTRLTEVSSVSGKSPYLALIKLEREKIELITETIEIQNQEGGFTDAYKVLTKDFYLKF